MLHQNDIRKLLGQSILALFVLMQINLVVFRHAHKLESGKVIVHAHPCKSSGNAPFQPNSHTTNELYTLDLLVNATFISVVVASFLFVWRQIAEVKHQFVYTLCGYSVNYTHRFLRGPPVFC